MTNLSSTIVQRLWNYCNILRDESTEDSANLPDPEILAAEIIEGLKSALEQFEGIEADLGKGEEYRLQIWKGHFGRDRPIVSTGECPHLI